MCTSSEGAVDLVGMEALISILSERLFVEQIARWEGRTFAGKILSLDCCVGKSLVPVHLHDMISLGGARREVGMHDRLNKYMYLIRDPQSSRERMGWY